MNPINLMSAAELARRIRAKQLSPVEVVDAHIERIERVNDSINAVVTTRFDEARVEAKRAADAVRDGSELGLLHGVPFTVKDSMDVAGTRSTCGLTARADRVARADAVCVERMRAAGAIALGKTNTPDACWAQETDNLLFGRTNNPWDTARSAGGSSGGEAAIIAACGSPLGLGSDIAGSIRLPAHFNGVVGLRPTSQTIPEDGVWPPAEPPLADLEAVGPFGRRVEDVSLAFDALCGARRATDLDVDSLRDRPIAWWYADGVYPCSDRVREAVRAATQVLCNAGMAPVAGAPAHRRWALVGWLAYNGSEGRESIARAFGGGERWSPFAALLDTLRGRPRVGGPALASWIGSHVGAAATSLAGVDGAKWRARLRAELADLIGDQGVAISPIFPSAAPYHGWTRGLRSTLTMGYQAWVNLAGLPGLAVPVAASGDGLPIGIQIVGAPGTEKTILTAGLAVQNALAPEWRGPPGD
jgi:Asp-tRNA(Asn)/Glu-tRNA(Gln) amidotransferase A subunit family amidase